MIELLQAMPQVFSFDLSPGRGARFKGKSRKRSKAQWLPHPTPPLMGASLKCRFEISVCFR
jgi:hypothetical protein